MDAQDNEDEMKSKTTETREEIKKADDMAKDVSYEAEQKDAKQGPHVL